MHPGGAGQDDLTADFVLSRFPHASIMRNHHAALERPDFAQFGEDCSDRLDGIVTTVTQLGPCLPVFGGHEPSPGAYSFHHV